MAATNEADMKKGHITDTTAYSECKYDCSGEISKLLTSNKRFQSLAERRDESIFDDRIIQIVSKGKYATQWQGLNMMKDCFDMVIYQQLIWEVRPKTIIETGAYTGACALWMADTAKMFGVDTHVYSIDIDLGLVDQLAIDNEKVTIKQGDAKEIAKSFPPDLLKDMPHPWVVSEDCHVDVVGVMEYFHQYMKIGDYFIIEDTAPHTPLVSGQGFLEGVVYEKWGRRKLDLLRGFLDRYEDYYRIDSYYTDYFGYNGTFNWHGYIRRIK